MTDYPGEQTLDDLDQINPGYNYPRWRELYDGFYPNQTESVALAADEEFVVLSTAWILRATDPALGACNWIIELETAAELELSTGFDADWSYDWGAVPWTSLGTQAFGPGRHAIALPMADRNLSHLGVDGQVALKVKAVGVCTVTGLYLQLEPVGGLMVATGETMPGEWITPAPVPHFAPVTYYRTHKHGEATAPGGGIGSVNDGEPVMDAAYAAALSASPEPTSWVAYGGTTEIFTDTYMSVSTNYGDTLLSAVADFYVGTLTVKAMSGDTEFRPFPAEVSAYRYRRDWLSIEWNDTQTANNVGWEPGWLIPTAFYWEKHVARPETDPSPHGDTASFSYYGTVAGSSAPLNTSRQSDVIAASPTGALPFTPPAGDVVLGDASTTWHSGQDYIPQGPNGWMLGNQVSLDIIAGWQSFTSVSWSSNLSDYYMPTPRELVQLPDVRMIVPVFAPSPDAITGEPPVVVLYPLRQKQRDDGLARSVVRARSTHSKQRSVRQRGYQ